MPRPRLHADATARIRASQQARLAAGGHRLQIIVGPGAAQALAALLARDGGTATAAVERALVNEALKTTPATASARPGHV